MESSFQRWMLCSMSDFQYSSSLISTVLSRLFLIDFLHICAKAALITIPADKAMPGIGTAFTSLEQSTNGTFLPHRRIFRCRQGLTPASVIYMLHCDFLPECKKAPESSHENFGAFYANLFYIVGSVNADSSCGCACAIRCCKSGTRFVICSCILPRHFSRS